jgi:hypothetical protein
MTNDEIRQAHVDHFFLRSDIIGLVETNTPSRWSKPITHTSKAATVYDFSKGIMVNVEYLNVRR